MAKAASDLWQDVGRMPEAPSGPPRWLLSFVDLTGILVAFFVLMFSMKEMDISRYKELQKAMHKAFVPQPTLEEVRNMPASRLNAVNPGYRKSDGAVYLKNLLARRLADDPFWRTVQPVVAEESFEWPVPPGALSGNGLTPAGEAALARLAAVIRNWENPMHLVVRDPGKDRWVTFAQALKAQEILVANGAAVTGVQMQAGASGAALMTLKVQQR